jgi:uncharacterized SAM-binding protein YcdF (DUF218 family)
MHEIAKVAGFLLAPLTVALALGLAATVFGMAGRRRAALLAGVVALVGLWLASTPAVATLLTRSLERLHPERTVDATPPADAVVVLGGALSGAYPPTRPTFVLGSGASRVWHAAALYKAGKAKAVIVAARNEREHPDWEPEAEAIVGMLRALGVPPAAIHLRGSSRNTRENTRQAIAVLRDLGARSALLVTSAMHMERAVRTFDLVNRGPDRVTVIPASTDTRALPVPFTWEMWLPTGSGLVNVTRAIKEYAGIAGLAMM